MSRNGYKVSASADSIVITPKRTSNILGSLINLFGGVNIRFQGIPDIDKIELRKNEIEIFSEKNIKIQTVDIEGIFNEYYDHQHLDRNQTYEISEGIVVLAIKNEDPLRIMKMQQDEGRMLRSELKYIVQVLSDFMEVPFLDEKNMTGKNTPPSTFIKWLLGSSINND